LDMFEQTLLIHPASARKTGALAASFLAQMTIVGVLVVGPLLYTQALPLLPIAAGIFVTAKPPERRVEVKPTTEATESGPRRIFDYRSVAATKARPESARTTEIQGDFGPVAIDVVSGAIATGVMGDSRALPTFVGPTATAVVVKTAIAPAVETKPIRLSGGVLAGKLITQVVPKYPALARQIRVSGTVHLLGIIGKDGRVRDLRVVDGHPMLRQAAFEAVSQWVYAPTLLNGLPVEVEAPIDVNFTLR
jgi:protein TonB